MVRSDDGEKWARPDPAGPDPASGSDGPGDQTVPPRDSFVRPYHEGAGRRYDGPDAGSRSSWDSRDGFERPTDDPPTVQLAPPVYCSACGTPNRPTRPRCDRCGEPLHRPGAARSPRRSSQATAVLVVAGVALAALGVWYGVFARGSDAEIPVQATPTDTVQEPAPQPTEPEVTTYTVERGDSLSIIAQRFDTTVEALVAANELDDPNVLAVGQELVIPAASDVEGGIDLEPDSPDPPDSQENDGPVPDSTPSP